jgi:hypothetical protein
MINFETSPDPSLRCVEIDLKKRLDSSALWIAWNRRVPTVFGVSRGQATSGIVLSFEISIFFRASRASGPILLA